MPTRLSLTILTLLLCLSELATAQIDPRLLARQLRNSPKPCLMRLRLLALLLTLCQLAQAQSSFNDLNQQVLTLYKQGDHARAAVIAEKALNQAEQEFGKQHPSNATTINDLALLYWLLGQHEKALSLYLVCLTIREQTLGKQHPSYATMINDLALLYQSMGQYEKALPLYLESRTIRQQVLGKQHPDYASTLNDLANLYGSMGQYEKALPLYLDCLTILEKVLGKQHGNYAPILNNLARLYKDMGQYEKALPLYLDCLTIQEKALGKLHPNYATTLGSLADLYQAIGQYEDALPLYREDLAIREQAQGKQHPDYTSTLSSLALLYLLMGQYEKALPLALESRTISEQFFGKQHPNYATILNNLAGLYYRMGQYEKALPLYGECRTIQEHILGKQHPDYATTLNNLVQLYQAMNQSKPIAPLIGQGAAIYRQRVLADIAVLDENALRQYQQSFNRAELGSSMAHWTQDPQLAAVGYNQSLLDKGAGLLAYQQLERLLQTSTDTTVRLLADRRAGLRNQLRQLYNANADRAKTEPLEKQVQDLQQALVGLLPDYRRAFDELRVDWQQVQATLKPNEAAIEFVHFRYYHKRWTDSTYYAALVLRPGWATPRFVFLTEQRELNQLMGPANVERVVDYVNNLYGEAGRGGVVQAKVGEKPPCSLYAQLWQPIDSLLVGVKQIYYAPSGLLHRINLAAIGTGPRQRLSDKYRLTLLSSTRQVALPPKPARAYTNQALLLGNIPYELDSTAYQAANRTYRQGLGTNTRSGVVFVPKPAPADSTKQNRSGGNVFRPLDNTGPEVQSIADTLRQAGVRVEMPTGWQTSEEAVYYFTRPDSPARPRYLHIATHGFFNDDEPDTLRDRTLEGAYKARFVRSANPLMQSGLALAGGNYAYYEGGKPLAGQEDGILTAYEISLLDWRGVELAVLSACETGLGTIRGSEGVYGLQRALKMAGVRNIIMSLWQVDDEATASLMETFYGHLLRNPQRNIRQAYDRAIADMKRNTLNKPYLWAGFVLVE